MKRSLFIFRHGETDYNREQRFQGHLDIPLNETGTAQARQLIAPLERLGIQAIFSSDLTRAVQTAQIIAGKLGIPILSDPGLREAHLGEAQGLTIEQIEEKLGKETVARWRSPFLTDADASYPGGETGRQVLERALQALERLLRLAENSHYERIGVATHGGVIRRIARHLLGEDSAPVPIPNGILYHVEFSLSSDMKPRWTLVPHMPISFHGGRRG